MKWIVLLTVLLLIFGAIIFVAMRQLPLQDVSSYRIYYGNMNESILNKMKSYDMVVVEGLHFDPQMVSELQDAGVKVIGYISVSEVGHWDDEITGRLDRDTYLMENGKILKNGKNDLGDLSSRRFRNVLIDAIESRIISKGMDGIFFDTLDSVDLLDDKVLREEQIKGYIKLVKEIRAECENVVLIQNRGFNYLDFLERDMIDGLLWENFSAEMLDKEIYRKRAGMVTRLKWFKNVRPLALAYRNEIDSKAAATKKGWIFSYLNGQEGLSKWN
jgi:hypothetical protein